MTLKKFKSNTIKNASKKAVQKTAEQTGNLIGNKIAYKITKVLKSSPQSSLETKNFENDKEITKERYISQEKGQHITDNLKLI